MSNVLDDIKTMVREAKARQGISEFKTLTCLHCRLPFDVPRKPGQYPKYCWRTNCIEARLAAQREADRVRYQRRGHEQRMTQANHEKSLRAVMQPLYESDRVRLCVRELGEVCEILEEYYPTQDSPRLELKRFVVKTARARGKEPWRRALLELAACAVFLAAQYGEGIDRTVVRS